MRLREPVHVTTLAPAPDPSGDSKALSNGGCASSGGWRASGGAPERRAGKQLENKEAEGERSEATAAADAAAAAAAEADAEDGGDASWTRSEAELAPLQELRDELRAELEGAAGRSLVHSCGGEARCLLRYLRLAALQPAKAAEAVRATLQFREAVSYTHLTLPTICSV